MRNTKLAFRLVLGVFISLILMLGAGISFLYYMYFSVTSEKHMNVDKERNLFTETHMVGDNTSLHKHFTDSLKNVPIAHRFERLAIDEDNSFKNSINGGDLIPEREVKVQVDFSLMYMDDLERVLDIEESKNYKAEATYSYDGKDYLLEEVVFDTLFLQDLFGSNLPAQYKTNLPEIYTLGFRPFTSNYVSEYDTVSSKPVNPIVWELTSLTKDGPNHSAVQFLPYLSFRISDLSKGYIEGVIVHEDIGVHGAVKILKDKSLVFYEKMDTEIDLKLMEFQVKN